jgi:ABC-type Fe3+/spermidine/putrescine transport system ATPase subunit
MEARVLQPKTESGFYWVETAVGHLLARSNREDWQPLTGTKVLISVRPEALSFATLTKSSNHFSGRITATHYLGTTAQYELEMAGGLNIKVCEMNPQTIRQPSAAEVTLRAAPVDAVMLPLD